MKLATPEAFARDPETVLAFYDLRRRNLRDAKPNAAHFALARLEDALAKRGDSLTLVTQNIDDLHERAGSRRVVHMHGELLKARCGRCEAVRPWLDDLTVSDGCPNCGDAGALRPHVVWFGEMPLALDLIDRALRTRPISSSPSALRALSIPLPGSSSRRVPMACAPARSTSRRPTTRTCSTSSAWGRRTRRFRPGSRSLSEAWWNRTNLPAHSAASTLRSARVRALLWVAAYLTWSSSPETARKKYLGRTT